MKRSELEEAITFFLGEDVNKAMTDSGIGLPRRLSTAMIEAFLRLCEEHQHLLTPHEKKLEAAYLMLHGSQCCFTFDEED